MSVEEENNIPNGNLEGAESSTEPIVNDSNNEITEPVVTETPSTEVTDPVVETTPQDYTAITEPTAAQQALEDKGFIYADLQKEFNENQNITDATRAKLAEKGITDDVIDSYIEGRKAVAEQETNKIAEIVGGKENLDKLVNWAKENLSDEEKISINGITDKNILTSVMRDLERRMVEKEGITPNYIGETTGATTPAIYESQAQMFVDLRDPRYKNDEAFQNKVMKKIQASRSNGIDLGC